MVVNLNKKAAYFLLALFFIVLILPDFISSQNNFLSLSSNKQNYTLGENILIYANITNVNNYPANILLESVLLNKDRTYPEAIIPHQYLLNINESRIILLYNISIDENFKNGEYVLEVRESVNGRLSGIKQISFSVRGIPLGRKLNVQICKDSACTKKSKIFLKGETVYINYKSEITGLSTSAKLILPDKSFQQLTLPTSIKAGQIGTYKLGVSASKKGYKSTMQEEQFAVIEKSANITALSGTSNNNAQTNALTGRVIQDNEINGNLIPILIAICVVMAIVAYIYFSRKKHPKIVRNL